MKYFVIFRGYEAPFPEFKTKAEARQYLRECIQEDISGAPYKVVKKRHSPDHYETTIGTKQGPCYSEAWVSRI